MVSLGEGEGCGPWKVARELTRVRGFFSPLSWPTL